MRTLVLWALLVLTQASHPLLAQAGLPDNNRYPPGVVVSEIDQLITIRERASVKTRPDTLYLLMKVQTESALLSQAIDQNNKAIGGFTAALNGVGVEPSAIRLCNFIVTPLLFGKGASFTRNVVITIPEVDRKSEATIEGLIARIQDLGARHGSQCITCIGSG